MNLVRQYTIKRPFRVFHSRPRYRQRDLLVRHFRLFITNLTPKVKLRIHRRPIRSVVNAYHFRNHRRRPTLSQTNDLRRVIRLRRTPRNSMNLIYHSVFMRQHGSLYGLPIKTSVPHHRGIRQIGPILPRRLIIGLHLSLTITRATFPNMTLRVKITNTIRYGITSRPRHVNRHDVLITNHIRRTPNPNGRRSTQLLIRNITRPIRKIKLRDPMMRRRIEPIRTRVVRQPM